MYALECPESSSSDSLQWDDTAFCQHRMQYCPMFRYIHYTCYQALWPWLSSPLFTLTLCCELLTFNVFPQDSRIIALMSAFSITAGLSCGESVDTTFYKAYPRGVVGNIMLQFVPCSHPNFPHNLWQVHSELHYYALYCYGVFGNAESLAARY